MEVTVDAKGRRVAMYRPYIDQEEYARNVLVYDPNGYNISSGLYDQPRQCCESWVNHLRKSGRPPNKIYDRYGTQYKY